MKAPLSFHYDLYATQISPDMSQAGVTRFPLLTFFFYQNGLRDHCAEHVPAVY